MNRRAYFLTFVLIVVWPVLTIPAGVFSRSYFAFWVMIATAWGFSAAIAITLLPLTESWDTIDQIVNGVLQYVFCVKVGVEENEPGEEGVVVRNQV